MTKATGKAQDGGDDEGGRRFRKAERSFVEKARSPKKARDAERPPEGQESAPGDPRQMHDEADPHTEENLDHGLKETFPASDPVSISPGSD